MSTRARGLVLQRQPARASVVVRLLQEAFGFIALLVGLFLLVAGPLTIFFAGLLLPVLLPILIPVIVIVAIVGNCVRHCQNWLDRF